MNFPYEWYSLVRWTPAVEREATSVTLNNLTQMRYCVLLEIEYSIESGQTNTDNLRRLIGIEQGHRP